MLHDHARIKAFAEPAAIDADVVGDGGEIAQPLAHQGVDQVLRNAAEAEAAEHEGCAGGDVMDRLIGGSKDLAHALILPQNNTCHRDTEKALFTTRSIKTRCHPEAVLWTKDLFVNFKNKHKNKSFGRFIPSGWQEVELPFFTVSTPQRIECIGFLELLMEPI